MFSHILMTSTSIRSSKPQLQVLRNRPTGPNKLTEHVLSSDAKTGQTRQETGDRGTTISMRNPKGSCAKFECRTLWNLSLNIFVAKITWYSCTVVNTCLLGYPWTVPAQPACCFFIVCSWGFVRRLHCTICKTPLPEEFG